MSPTLRRIRWRLIWMSVLALLVSLGSFYLNQWVYSYSDDQCFWKVQGNKVLIAEILPNGVAEIANLLEGDELVQIQGRKVSPRTLQRAQAFINSQPEQRVLAYTVRRWDAEAKEHRTLVLPVKMVKPFNWVSFSVLLTGLVAWALGLLVVVSSPQRKIARHFFYMGLLALLMPVAIRGTVGNVPLEVTVPTLVLEGLILSLAPTLWVHFFLRFPHPFPLRTQRIFLLVLYGGFLVVGAVLTGLRVLQAGLGPDFLGEFLRLAGFGAERVFFWGNALAVVTGLALFWIGSFRLSERRRRGLLPALIFTTALLVDLGAYNVLSYQAQGQSLMFQREAWVFFVPLPLLPLSFAYAILRHGLMDVRRAIVRWVTYFAVLGLTLGLYLAGLAYLFSLSFQTIPPAWVGALVGLSALPLGWLLRWLLQALRRRFRRDLQSARELIMGGLRETTKRLSEEGLLATLKENLQEAFRPQLLMVLPVTGGAVELPALWDLDLEEPGAEALGQARRLLLPPGLLRHARENRELVLGLGTDEAEWIRDQGHNLRTHLDALEAQVMVLILVNNEPHTAILLGGKYAELNYGREDRELLREVSLATGIVLETAVLHRRILDQGRLEQELQTARRIQESLITSEAPALPGFQMALRLEPALETGGDLLWVKRRPGDRWIAAVGDVSGKGLAAALYMSQATALLKFASQQQGWDMAAILPALDQTMRNLMGPRDFLTLTLLEWEPTGRFRLARAGHPPALVVGGPNASEVRELAPSGRGLGLRPAGAPDWQVLEGTLQPGEWLAMYSDGLTEAMNRQGELYGQERFTDVLQRLWGTGSVRAACEAVFREVAAFEAQNRDDRTLFILGRERT